MKIFKCETCKNMLVTGDGDNWDRLPPLCTVCRVEMVRVEK